LREGWRGRGEDREKEFAEDIKGFLKLKVLSLYIECKVELKFV